ncbi:unnamed protein product [Bursaphelenchus xylophilus]|uniref:(pine wood nematode) hypothetical protein n=1 Tax=Bursaphelenchus xylophilus TaxID=6326 RepID=A0A1I7S607_BURXY|nr:unnamed protein product [Bursaphelenchus xylophilus]CAG9082422.1 unnamed protein product [Bursaphelenchus xylophilus]
MTHSVPSRIVLVGSTTQKLSDRFQSLSAPRFTDRTAMDGPRNFLYDDYMDSDLYGQGAVDNFGAGGRADSFRRRANARSAIDMPLDSYTSTSRRPIPSRSRFADDFPTRQPVHARRMATALGIPARRQALDYDDYPAPRRGVRRVIREVIDDDEPVEEIVRVIRKPRIQKTRTITVVRKVPITQRVRKPGVKPTITRTAFKSKGRPGPSKDRSGPSPRRVSSGGIQKRKDRKESKPKPSHGQLDAELDAYMRSSKHPRIAL